MIIPHQVDTSIRGRMNDVHKAFDAGAFLSAISMALTLPDVCGARLYPNCKSCGKRYADWFDSYVAPVYIGPRLHEEDAWEPQNGKEPDPYETYCFSGADCYQLRCVYLHEGTNAPDISKGTTPYRIIQFRVFSNTQSGCNGVGWSKGDGDATGLLKIDLDLRKFLQALEAGINSFLNDYPEMNEDKGSDSFLYQPVLDFRCEATKNL